MTRHLIIALGILAVFLGVLRVRLDVDVLALLPRQMKEVQGLQLFLDHFSKREELIVTLEGSDPDALAAHHESLAEHLRDVRPELGTVVSENMWISGSSEALGEMVAWLLVNALPPDEFAQAVRALAPNARNAILEDSLDTIASSIEFDQALTLAYDPYQLVHALRKRQGHLTEGGDAFVSDDGQCRVLYLTASPNHSNVVTWVNAVKQSAQTWRTHSPDRANVQLGFTGEPVFQTEIAASMERDMKRSGLTALILTSLIFTLAYRRLRPLLVLLGSLTLTFALTLGLAGWLLPNMTVMSVGFASILIGLTVDYGVIIYQKAISETLSREQLRKRTQRSVGWAAATTAAAFAALGLSIVPGIATLGQLVAIGILVGAIVMLWLFPLLLKVGSTAPRRAMDWPGKAWIALPVLGLLLLLALLPLFMGLPKLDTSTEALRPRDSPAYGAMDRLQAKLTGDTSTELAILSLKPDPQAQLDRWETELESHTTNARFPRALVPDKAQQSANLGSLEDELLDLPALRQEANTAGFEPEAMDLTSSIVTHWKSWQDTGVPQAPSSTAAERLWSRLLTTDGKHLLMTLTPRENQTEGFWQWLDKQSDSFPVSWPRITTQLNERVPQDLRVVGVGLAIAVLIMLSLTFRAWKLIGLCLLTTSLTLASLFGAMRLLGWEWNFFSLGALLLTVGAGLDYSIHILLEHRHTNGNMQAVRQGVVRALSICALSTVAGFGSISWASNQGLASLGQVCALALTLNALVSLVALPWLLERGGRSATS